MLTTRKKLVRPEGQPTSPIEDQVAQALFDLEAQNQNPDLKALYTDLVFSSAKEIEVSSGKKAVVVFVPYRLLKSFHHIQSRRELDKKFSGKHVLVVAQRKILRKPSKNNHKKQQKRPMSRTLTKVHEAILEDLVYPTDIIGKRTRVRTDGSKLLKVFLDKKDQSNTDKLDTFAVVYKKLTGKDAVFEYPVVQKEN